MKLGEFRVCRLCDMDIWRVERFTAPRWFLFWRQPEWRCVMLMSIMEMCYGASHPAEYSSHEKAVAAMDRFQQQERESQLRQQGAWKCGLFVLLLASLASPLAAQRIDLPSVIAAAGASFADAAITSHVLASGRCIEKNPVFGSHPSDAKLYLSTAATVSGLIALNYFMARTKASQRVSRILNWSIAGLEGSVVVHNLKACS